MFVLWVEIYLLGEDREENGKGDRYREGGVEGGKERGIQEKGDFYRNYFIYFIDYVKFI